MRKCTICGKEKEDEFFIHDKYAKDGIRNVCLECNKKRAKIRRERSQKHLEELEKKLNDYIQIKSISIDMSTNEAPYNRIYAKPIEKQGDVLLCEFESVNYDIEQKVLKEENKKLKELLKEYEKQLSEIKNAYIDLTTQDEYGSYYIDEAKLFVEIVGKTIIDFKTEE